MRKSFTLDTFVAGKLERDASFMGAAKGFSVALGQGASQFSVFLAETGSAGSIGLIAVLVQPICRPALLLLRSRAACRQEINYT